MGPLGTGLPSIQNSEDQADYCGEEDVGQKKTWTHRKSRFYGSRGGDYLENTIGRGETDNGGFESYVNIFDLVNPDWSSVCSPVLNSSLHDDPTQCVTYNLHLIPAIPP